MSMRRKQDCICAMQYDEMKRNTCKCSCLCLKAARACRGYVRGSEVAFLVIDIYIRMREYECVIDVPSV